MLARRHLEAVADEDVREAVDPAVRAAREGVLLFRDVFEESVGLGGGEVGVEFEDAAVSGVGLVPLEVTAGFCFAHAMHAHLSIIETIYIYGCIVAGGFSNEIFFFF